MNVLLQKHGAKHVYKVPEGLRELCADIAREVLRSQPRDIYCFIADYVETLLITRENAKVAVKVVNNILLGSQTIVDILHRAGLSLEQIARAAPRIQKAFRAYLDAVDMRAAQVCDDPTYDAESRVSLQSILRTTGVPLEQAEKSARIIQTAFRGHYERMLLNESQGMIQWQRAAIRTLEILRKTGASQAEASRAAILIQATYRGYYTRRNLRMKMMAARPQEKKEDEVATIETDTTEPTKSVASAVAWLDDMTHEESRLERAHKAASVIQNAYKRYRGRKAASVPQVESQKSMVGAILNNLHQRVFDDIMTRKDIPTQFGDREDLAKAGEELRRAFKEQLARARVMEKEHDEKEKFDEPSAKPAPDDGVHLNGVEEDVEENREIEVESGRDGETNVWD